MLTFILMSLANEGASLERLDSNRWKVRETAERRLENRGWVGLPTTLAGKCSSNESIRNSCNRTIIRILNDSWIDKDFNLHYYQLNSWQSSDGKWYATAYVDRYMMTHHENRAYIWMCYTYGRMSGRLCLPMENYANEIYYESTVATKTYEEMFQQLNLRFR
jgi:hypothetical protein